MKSFFLATVTCIIGFTVCESALNSFSFTNPLEAKKVQNQEPPNKCPLSKTIVHARIVCTAQFENETDPFEGFGRDFAEVAKNISPNDTAESIRPFVEKHRDMFVCVLNSTGIVKYGEDGKMELDETKTQNILSDSTPIDKKVAAEIEKELKPCVTMNAQEDVDMADILLCVLDAINRACDYGFVDNLVAPKNPLLL